LVDKSISDASGFEALDATQLVKHARRRGSAHAWHVDYDRQRTSGLRDFDAPSAPDVVRRGSSPKSSQPMRARNAASVATFRSCRRTSRLFESPRVHKASFASCEQAQGRPVERGPSARNHGDETLVYEARCGHRNRLTFGFRKREPNIFDGEGHRHPRRAVALVDDFAAVRLVHLAVEQRTREKSNATWGSTPLLRNRAMTSPMLCNLTGSEVTEFECDCCPRARGAPCGRTNRRA
jgi:hypothetical protein